jgi:hypothetical protein
VQMRIDHERIGIDEQRIAVGRPPRHRLGRRHRAAARSMLDDDGDVVRRADVVSDQPEQRARASSRRERADDPDGSGLGPCAGVPQNDGERGQQQAAVRGAMHSLIFPIGRSRLLPPLYCVSVMGRERGARISIAREGNSIPFERERGPEAPARPLASQVRRQPSKRGAPMIRQGEAPAGACIGSHSRRL